MESEEDRKIAEFIERQERLEKTKAERAEKVAELISRNYHIGDAIVLDTIGGTRFFGFYAGITEFPSPMIMVAASCIGFKGKWNEKWFDCIRTIPTGEVEYFNAIPVKR